MGARILVTGVADVQGRLAARLVRRPGVDRVLGLDTRAPGSQPAGLVDHVLTDVRSPELARLLRPHLITAIVDDDVLQFADGAYL